MTDRELLERAARAAGLRYTKPHPDYDGSLGLELCDEHGRGIGDWRPLTDDGDALRLAVKLGLSVLLHPGSHVDVVAENITEDADRFAAEGYGNDPLAATRRAIVRAAAAMAKDNRAVDLLTDPYLDELRAMDARLADAFDLFFNPLAASSVPSLSPDAGKDGAVGGLLKQGDAS